jgi:hypothetical protein
MKLATFNVNGVNGRLPVLLRWLEQSEPDVVCLQELKAQDEKFPTAAIEKAGLLGVLFGDMGLNTPSPEGFLGSECGPPIDSVDVADALQCFALMWHK